LRDRGQVPSEYIRYLGRDLVRLINLKLSESPPPCGGGGGLFLVSPERPLSLAYLSRASNVSGERSPFDGSCCGSGYHTVDSTPLGSPEEMEVPKYRVVMLGDAGVGKTALVSQFMTSEYMNTYDASLGKSTAKPSRFMKRRSYSRRTVEFFYEW
jgi:hypothetical protein